MDEHDLTIWLKKTDKQLAWLHDFFYRDFTQIDDITFFHDQRQDKRLPPEEGTWQSITIGDTWSGRDEYYWLRFTLNVPVLQAEQHFVIHAQLGRTGVGGNSGFEGLAFINRKIKQAVDSNHEEIYLDETYSDREIEVMIQLWTGLEGGGYPAIQYYTLDELNVGIIHQEIVDAYNYLKNIVGVITELDSDDPIRYDYLRLARGCFRKLWFDVDAKTMADVCREIVENVHEFSLSHMNEKKGYTITAVGHTHIDVAWLWRLKHTREKVIRSFSTILELMRINPDFKFFQSTPQDYAFLAEDCPELFAQIQQRVAEGRWEANGGTWLEPDTNIPSGESLTRQFLYGERFFRQNFMSKQNVLWLPDVFGYSASLPQIMRGFNINNFMTTKISWNDTNRMPHDTFYWQGIDGSRVLTHFITTVDAQNDYQNSGNWQYTYNGEITPHTIFGSYHVYADKDINSDILLSYGFGDGGGGPTREMLQNIKILNELPGIPKVVFGRVDDYFDCLNQTVQAQPEELSIWRGELYLEFHRGTYTSQGWIKKMNRRAEECMRTLEIRYTSAWVQSGIVYPSQQLRELWLILLRNQFHDILPGSSIHEVYEDARHEFATLFARIKAMTDQLDTQLTQQISVYNPLGWSVTQIVDDQLVKVPALTAETIVPLPVSKQPMAIIDGMTLTTPYYYLTYAVDGRLVSIIDRKTYREYLNESGGNVLTVYEDRPQDFDNWNIDADYQEKSTKLSAQTITIIENTSLRVSIEFSYSYGHSLITQVMRLYANNPRIDFITTADWQEHQVLLRTAFNTTVLSENARFDIQYGNVLRSVNDNNSWEQAKFEVVGHKWADLSQRDFGVALLNDCKYGYRVKGQQLSLSLIKSGINPDYDADQGQHQFTYSLLPHQGDWLVGGVEQAAAELNQPLQIINSELSPLFTFRSQVPVAVDAIKHAEDEDAVVLRLHDYSGANFNAEIIPNFNVEHVVEVQLNEHDLVKPLNLSGKYAINLRPYEIKTLKFFKTD